ncbi:hypothetical protein GGF42_000407 [Coemansia sp. RSA 2424]|nr:hypothetical protein GGF42_000407 [Coemansia sp. RSA 2424]
MKRFIIPGLGIAVSLTLVCVVIFVILEDLEIKRNLTALINSTGGWGVLACGFIKLPIVFEHGPDHYYVVWESGCAANKSSLEWWANDTPVGGANVSRHVVNAQYKMIDKAHHRYSAIIGPVGLATKVHYRSFSQNLSTGDFTITRRNETELTRILVIADNQDESNEFRQVLSSIQNHYSKGNAPDAILHAGDSVQTASKLDHWQDHLFSPLEDGGGYQHVSPMVFVPGNHDHDKARTPTNGNVYTDMYHGIMTTEGLGEPAVVNGSYHRFFHTTSLGSARIIVLDSECPSPEQLEFLEQELQSEAFQSAQFRIVTVHIAPYIEFWDPSAWNKRGEKHWGEHVRLEYDPLFRRHNVDLVISGHQHNYQRATVQRDPQSKHSSSITYAIVGGAGGELDLVRVENWNMYNVTYLDHHFVSLEVENQELRWTAKNKGGDTIDTFSIVR